ncbi:MAG: hypothetical protein GWN03_04030, partial [Gammaproteobacteria bacterium]|nr:hypothetical protein [Gammaproteobacteria bacterium]
ALYVAIGGLMGALYFLLLLQAVRLQTARARSTPIVALYLARIAVAVVGFWIVAQRGASPLVLAFAGFLAARFVIQRHIETR